MRSLRTKITFITLSVVVLIVIIISSLSVVFIQRAEHRKSSQILLLLCETGESNLDYYFNSVQKSVAKVAEFTRSDIRGTDDEALSAHVERVRDYFGIRAERTNGVLTYYYRIDPEVSSTVKGFWYTDLTGTGFKEEEPTPIEKYDTSDTTQLVWFTVPKNEGKDIWQPPYYTDSLKDVKVISYNMPIYYNRAFVGVVGIEIDYSTMAEQVDSIRLYDNGYAFLNDSEGNLFYHPRIDLANLRAEDKPITPDGVLSESTFMRYSFNGVEKEAAWLALSNGMRLNVCVPVSEMEGDWQGLIVNIVIVAAEVLVVAMLFILFYTGRISKPLKQLTYAAEQADKGNYDYKLTYDKDDELGNLTKTFKRLSAHMRDNISSLNRQAFVDALTHVKNKGAFTKYLDDLQKQMDNGDMPEDIAFGVFDCDDLKQVNDKYGHDKGDVYLQTASRAICNVFRGSPVFRIGGDEFSVILKGDDFDNRAALIKQFENTVARINASTDNRWEQVHISMGIVEFDPNNDHAVSDLVRRADKVMYDNKRSRKNANSEN